jgi:hypothetical protein
LRNDLHAMAENARSLAVALALRPSCERQGPVRIGYARLRVSTGTDPAPWIIIVAPTTLNELVGNCAGVERWSLAGLVVFVLLGGCVGSPGVMAPPTTSASQSVAPPVALSETTGAIKGWVTDDELRPLPGATIGIGTEEKGQSDEQGSFTLNDVAPGQIQLLVQRVGYEAGRVGLEVTAAHVSWANVSLRPLRILVAYIETVPRTAFIDAGVDRRLDTALKPVHAMCSACKFPFVLIDDPQGFKLEVMFKPTIDYPMHDEQICVDITRNYDGNAPLTTLATGNWVGSVCLVDRGNATLAKDALVRPRDQLTLYIGSDMGYPMFQQRAEFMVSTSHYAPFDPNWTALPPK